MIRRPAAPRRPPRIVGAGYGEEPTSGDSQSESNESAVRRPALASRPKKASTLRMSFNPDDGDDAEDESSAVVKPKRKKPLGRVVVERTADSSMAIDKAQPAQDPSSSGYSKAFLEQLKLSTPSTPQNVSDQQDSEGTDLDGAMIVDTDTGQSALVKQGQTKILSEAEIRERKDRRARLAAEQKAEEFISLDDDNQYLDEDSGQLILRPAEKYTESRLIRDDEDVLEGFENYTEDSRLQFGRKAQKEARKSKRREMADAIAAAEGEEDDDGDEENSEFERNARFEVAQARKGAYGLHKRDNEHEYHRPRTPQRITPIPPLSDIARDLRERLEVKKAEASRLRTRRAALAVEKTEIEETKHWIQGQLDSAAKVYEKAKEDMEAAANAPPTTNGRPSEGEKPNAQPEGRDGIDHVDRAVEGEGHSVLDGDEGEEDYVPRFGR